MKTRTIAVLIALLGLALVPLGTAFAKEIGKLTITGPGIKTPIEITDRATLLDVGDSMLDFESGRMAAPKFVTGDTPYYEITRSFMDGGTVIGTDRLRVYFPPDGSRAMFFYVGLDDPGFSSEKNQWFQASQAAETALRGILKQHGVTPGAAIQQPVAPKPAQPVEAAAPPQSPLVDNAPIIGGSLLVLALALGGAAWLSRRPRTSA